MTDTTETVPGAMARESEDELIEKLARAIAPYDFSVIDGFEGETHPQSLANKPIFEADCDKARRAARAVLRTGLVVPRSALSAISAPEAQREGCPVSISGVGEQIDAAMDELEAHHPVSAMTHLEEAKARLDRLAGPRSEPQREGLADRVGKLAGYHSERANLSKRDAKKAVRDRVPFHEQAKATLYEAAIALGRPVAREGLAGRLAELSAKATQGEWIAEDCETEGSYGATTSYEIVNEARQTIMDATNSGVAVIHTDASEDGSRQWDEQGRADAHLAAELVNAYRSGALALHATSQPLPQEGGKVDPVAAFYGAYAASFATQPPTPSADEPAEHLTLGAIKGRDRLASVQATPSAAPDALAALVTADDEHEAAVAAYNAEYENQRRLGVFPMRLRHEEARMNAARKGWYAAVRTAIEAGRAAIAQAETGTAAASEAVAGLGTIGDEYLSPAMLAKRYPPAAPSPEPSRQGVEAMRDGCCSAISPCPHQQRDPSTICDVCERAAALAQPERGA